MPGQEQEKNQGGKKLMDQEDVRNIATQVKALIDQGKEKELVSDQLTAVNRKIGETSAGLEELRKLFCSPDGTICFATQEQLDTYLKAHDEKIGKIGTMLTEVVAKIGTMKPPKGDLPEGVKVLEPMTEEKRKTLTDEQNRNRDSQISINDRALNQTSNDRWRQLDETDKDRVVAKPDMRVRFFESLTDEERKSIMLVGCKDGKCKVLRSKLEAEEGYKIYKKDAKGTFQPIDEPEKKPILF